MTGADFPEFTPGRPPDNIRRFPRILIFAAIIAASLIPHLKGITSPVLDYHYHRQANTAAIARNYNRDGLHFFHPRISWDGHNHDRAATEFPLYMWLVGLFWNLWGLGEMWGRLLSVGFSALTSVVLFLFLESWIGTESAFWGSCFFGMLPVEVYFGRTVQPEALALLATAVAFYSLNRYLDTVSPSPQTFPSGGGQNERLFPRQGEGISILWWILSILSAALAIGHKLPYAYLLGVCAAMIFSRLGKKAFSDMWLWAYPVFVGALVVRWYAFAATAPTYVVPTSTGGFLEQLDYGHLPYFIFYQTFSRFPELAATYSGLLMFAVGAFVLLGRRKQWFFGAWWLLVWAYVCFGGGYAFQHEYAALPFALVNAAFIGVGFSELRSRALRLMGPARQWAAAGLVVLALGVPVHAFLRIGHWYRLNYSFLLRIQPVVDRISGKDDLFFCSQRANSLYLYFINREGWSWSIQERGMDHLADVDEIIGKGAKFLLTAKDDAFATDKTEYAKHFLRKYPVAYEDKDILILKLRPA